jgi:multidrug efflux pump subunit AcrA (membrane-fusion protein)
MGEPWPRGATDLFRSPMVGAAEPAAPALALFATVLAAKSLPSAAHRLVAALAGDFGFDRVSLGLRERGRTSLIASSSLDPSNPQAELPQRLLGAMDEALDQAVAIAWPFGTEPSGEGADTIHCEHRALQRAVGGVVATVPLGFDGEPFAAVCVERHDGLALTPAELERLEQVLRLAAPTLRWMQRGDQPWYRRAGFELMEGLVALRQPERRLKRQLLTVAALALLFVAVAPLEYSVGGRARIEGAEQRVLSAPTDGFVKLAHVRPGDRVKAGDALVDLLEQDLRLERERWTSQLAQHENAYAASMARSDRVGASTSMARVVEAQSQLALVDEQLVRGRMTAPFDALVVDGDLSQSIGAPVRQGDKLLTLATTDHYRVVVEVDETDIARVQAGQGGSLVLSSMPWDRQGLVVERIAPLAKAVEGRNVFEVEARLADPTADLRPGLIGRADVAVGRLPPLWAWTRHAFDRARLALWSWIG